MLSEQLVLLLMVVLAILRPPKVKFPTSCNVSMMCKYISSSLIFFFVAFSTKYSKENCTTQYNTAFECMRDNKMSDGACADALDTFSNCRQ